MNGTSFYNKVHFYVHAICDDCDMVAWSCKTSILCVAFKFMLWCSGTNIHAHLPLSCCVGIRLSEDQVALCQFREALVLYLERLETYEVNFCPVLHVCAVWLMSIVTVACHSYMYMAGIQHDTVV